jgi:peptidoglycan hydrolase-like protein with peptidoglycan-binding domain
MSNYPFVQAKHFTPTSGRRIDLLVDHVMVAPETSDRAEACAQMFATTTRSASAHYCVDSNSIVQGVKDNDVAWAAPGANSDGIQIEQAGTIQTPDQWRDSYSTAMLELSCKLKAEKAKEHGIPVVWLSAADLKANKRGITDHWQATLAFRMSTHTDCGVDYPRDKVIAMVRDMVDHDHNDHADPVKPEFPTIQLGYVGWLAKRAQKLLRSHGYMMDLEPDKQFDAAMESAVRRFQKAEHISVDGIIGPVTWKHLREKETP